MLTRPTVRTVAADLAPQKQTPPISGSVKDFGCRPARRHPRALGRRPKSAHGRTRGPRITAYGILAILMQRRTGRDAFGRRLRGGSRLRRRLSGKVLPDVRMEGMPRICMIGVEASLCVDDRPRLFGVESGYFSTYSFTLSCRITTPSSGFV